MEVGDNSLLSMILYDPLTKNNAILQINTYISQSVRMSSLSLTIGFFFIFYSFKS